MLLLIEDFSDMKKQRCHTITHTRDHIRAITHTRDHTHARAQMCLRLLYDKFISESQTSVVSCLRGFHRNIIWILSHICTCCRWLQCFKTRFVIIYLLRKHLYVEDFFQILKIKFWKFLFLLSRGLIWSSKFTQSLFLDQIFIQLFHYKQKQLV